jgi:hypothetical protein
MKEMKKIILIVILITMALPAVSFAGGEKASNLVVVADTRVLSDTGPYHSFVKYLANAYNTNIIVFAVWCTALTALYGVSLGLLMDFLMERSGLDLKNRKIIEH